jgi:EAL domain-containing protein (putative c-di-GMP-specific phosphodiesterase class I)/GGDEF domain-containing protein
VTEHPDRTKLASPRQAKAWISARLAPDGAVAALLVSFSRFDAINEAFGRAIGDVVLDAAIRRIERVAGSGEGSLIARMSDHEVGILLAGGASLAEARFLATRLAETMAPPFMAGDDVVALACRIGGAASEEGDDSAALLRRARAALTEAESGDGAPVRIVEPRSGTRVRGDRLEADLRRALSRGEIEMLFQPQAETASGRVVGAEALARWRHPRHGELGAELLFNVAERSDYLAILSEHVQRSALARAANWPASLGHLRLSVNITAADIVRPGFTAHFLVLVAESGFDRARLTVEVTEGGLIADLPAAAALLAELRTAGVRTAIDDFGTGYSSLAYLKALPLDYLKVDKSLCADIGHSPRGRIVAAGVIDMARSLGLQVIAEGVESEAQRALLAAAGCEFYQGFLCAPPLDVEKLAALVAS